MTRHGIEVSQNKDVSATRQEDLLYTSEYQSPKISSTKTGVLNTNSGGNAILVIPHGLTYAPAVFVYIKYPDGTWHATSNNGSYAETSASFVTLTITGLTANSSYYYKFWILTDPAQEVTNV